jgi:predicted kinase
VKNKLLILCGIPFAGKSTLADKLVSNYGFSRVDLDEIKFELFGKDIDDDQFTQSQWDRVYQQMYQQIESLLKKGKSVIHDTGNFTKQ